MKAQKRRRKKRPLRAPESASRAVAPSGEDDESKALYGLMEAIESISLEDASSAYAEAGGDVNTAAEILFGEFGSESGSGSGSVSGFSVTCSSSGRSEGSLEGNLVMSGKGCRGGNKQKKVVAATGTVSTVLGKDYVSKLGRRGDRVKGKEFGRGALVMEEAERFLCSMLGDDCDIGLDVVKDVLCECKHDVEKALDALLELASSFKCSRNNGCLEDIVDGEDDPILLGRHSYYLTDGSSDCTSHSSEMGTNIHESAWGSGRRLWVGVMKTASLQKQGLRGSPDPTMWELCALRCPFPCNQFIGQRALISDLMASNPSLTEHCLLFPFRNKDLGQFLKALLDTPCPNNSTISDSNLPQKVLESLFNTPTSSERERIPMNWRNVVRKMKSLGAGADVHANSETIPQQNVYAKGEEYHLFRNSASQHWQSVRSCYGKAAAAYSNGEYDYASYLSDQGKLQTKLARAADEEASQNIFQARNKDIENVITIDFHGQHVKQAMRLLKLHLLFGTYVQSIQYLRVITGCGSHGVGKSKVKESVIKLLENECIKWKEENRGTLLIRVEGCSEYSFLDTESDTE